MNILETIYKKRAGLGLCLGLGVGLALLITGHALAQEIGVSDDKILLGQSAAFSGPAAQLGIQMHAGAKAYFDAVNARGGVFGRRIEIITADDKYEPELAVKNTRKLLDTGVFSLFGYIGTPTSNAVLPMFTDEKVPFFAPFTGAQSLREPFNRNIFNIRASYFDETDYLVRQLVSMGQQNIVVFYQNDAYGKAGLQGVERALAKLNRKLVATATVERNSVDISEATNKILPLRPDVIIQISAYKSCAAFIRSMRENGYTGSFYNVSFVGSQALADALQENGRGVGISQVVPPPWKKSIPLVTEYKNVMQRAGVQDVNFSSLEGYIAAKVFVEGLKRAGKNLTRQNFIGAMETIDVSNFNTGGFDINFSPTNHNGSKFVELTVITKDKKFLY